jgi:hypothetical protein
VKTPDPAEGAAAIRARRVLRRLSLFLVAPAFAVFAASALAGAKGAFQINGSVSNADPVVTNPVYDNVRGACMGGGWNATSSVSGTFHYDVYRFRNISEATLLCVNVSLAVSAGSVDAAVYQNAFNPNNLSNYRADTGGLGPGQTRTVDFLALANSTGESYFDVVVWETCTACGGTYTLLVEGTSIIMVSGGGPTATSGLQSFRASSAPKGVLVRWRTRSEHDALGFNLYRGDRKKIRLTRHLVRASGGGSGHTYSYLDRSPRKGKSPPYYLEVVQRSGSKIMFGPALRTTG